MLFEHFTWFPFQGESSGVLEISINIITGEGQSSELLSFSRVGILGKGRGKQECLMHSILFSWNFHFKNLRLTSEEEFLFSPFKEEAFLQKYVFSHLDLVKQSYCPLLNSYKAF